MVIVRKIAFIEIRDAIIHTYFLNGKSSSSQNKEFIYLVGALMKYFLKGNAPLAWKSNK